MARTSDPTADQLPDRSEGGPENPRASLATRIEHDSLGQVLVPADRLWGAQTQRSLENFPIGRNRFQWGRAVIRGFGILKKCAASANADLGLISRDKSDLICRAAQEVIDGRWDSEFPLVVFQTGSGTQTNMNANEVIANRANQLARSQPAPYQPTYPVVNPIAHAVGQPVVHPVVHPNDDVNHGHSSNDAFPTVMHIAAVDQVQRELAPAIEGLCDTLRTKERTFTGIVMIGRTHLQDATPITLAQVISGWLAQLQQAMEAVRASLPGLYELAIGGTAVGTGLNAHPDFGRLTALKIAEATGVPFVSAKNKFAALSAHDAMVNTSGALRTLAGALMKIANDVRWYASGPRAGIGELRLPDNEPGSSIMPGKINPTQCEAMTQVAVQVFGNDHSIAFAGSQGAFQLNVYKPVMLHNLLESIQLLAEAARSFDERCVRGIEPETRQIEKHLEDSLMLVTALVPHIGYEKAAEISLRAHRGGTSLRDAAKLLGYVSEENFDRWVNPADMTGPAADR